ncbi:hypothetical protein K8640_17005 [Myxococcus sp. XM-1-1-1]|jgi:hypothetical protein|uniref:hypothetical protein n=1 Tax=Myxococcus sp. XM-1-1-1 TaxID=2874602 RepID=UPI001CBC9AFA|nr:hypothetical protein [Myxococcus sp. XM-1-1-1]MBZ4409905.1 hypothetical protein [Myxococcus sp. XM-1-1-1]
MPKLRASDVDSLFARADKLLDQYPRSFGTAKALLQEVLTAQPDHLEALHSLNQAHERDRDHSPGEWQRRFQEPQRAVRGRILELTKKVKADGGDTVAHRARALALAQHAENILRTDPTPARLKQAEDLLAESKSLDAKLPARRRGERGVMAWKAIHRARKGKPDAYQALLDWVAENPRPSPFHPDDHASAFRGLEGAFADEGFLEWLRARKPRVAKGQRAKDLVQGMLHVGDWDVSAELKGPVTTPCRVGRLLALRALGANLDFKVGGKSLLERAKKLGDKALVRELEALSGAKPDAKGKAPTAKKSKSAKKPSTAKESSNAKEVSAAKKSSAKKPANKKEVSATQQATPDVYTTAQVFADVHVTSDGTVRVLAGTPHPDSDHGYTAGDDLWDFDKSIKWNQPWDDRVWLEQIHMDIDEDELEANGLSYDVDFNRLLIHDGKTWTRTKLPKALPYGYVAPVLRDLGAPWGLSAFGVSALAFDGGGKGWKVKEVSGPGGLNLVDAVVHDGVLYGLCKQNGLGRLVPEGKNLSLELLGDEQSGLHRLFSHEGTLYAFGDDGVFVLEDGALAQLQPTRAPVRALCAAPEQGVYLHTDEHAWYLPPKGKARKLALPKDGIHSIAFFKNRLFVSVGQQVLRLEKDRAVAVKLPSPAPGVARLVVAGDRLWTVFPHHLTSSRDGKQFEPIAFR